MGIIQKKPWENHKNLNLGFRTLTLSPLSPYILGPNLFAYKLGFCYDPSPSIWANDPNSALFFWQASLGLNTSWGLKKLSIEPCSCPLWAELYEVRKQERRVESTLRTGT